jgi:cytochrome c peroxidase
MAHSSTPSRILPLLAALAGAIPASAQLPANSTVAFAPQTGASFMKMSISDPGNGFWTLSYSTDLANWYPFQAIKVNNSSYAINLHLLENTPRAFYRASYDAAQQTGSNSVGQSLLLPALADNFSNPSLPPHFLAPQIVAQDNAPLNNPTTDAGATLGRVLFYDKRLSANNSVSCSSCHQQEHGFSDPRQFSIGFEGGATGRNSMGLTNAKYYQRGHFFWDERAATLEDQVLGPIQNDVEMGLTLGELVSKVAAEDFYAELFTDAFGDDTVTSNRISRALAQFVRSIISTESKFDLGRASNFSNFTAQENQGRGLFNGRGRCDTCHGSDNFVPNNVFNNGLENPSTDPGVGGITGRPQDLGKFKVPSLRNIALTSPYMHDGRFDTLEEVVEFYNSQIADHPNLAPQLRDGRPPRPGQPPQPGGPIRLNLSPAERNALVAFLHTLTDPNLATAPKFSDPFDYGD